MSRNLAQPLMSSANDPFYAFKDALRSAVDRLKLKHEKWNNLIQHTNTAESVVFQTTDSELKKALEETEKDLRGIQMTVAFVEKEPSKFAHIDASELASRKKFVKEIEDDISTIKRNLNSTKIRGKLERDERELLQRRTDRERASAKPTTKYERANQDFMSSQKQSQTQLVHEQDQHLDALDSSLTRIGQMAQNINTELEEQERMIDDIDEGMDETQSNMDRALAGIQKLLKTKDNCQLCTIFILCAVVVGLFVAVLS